MWKPLPSKGIKENQRWLVILVLLSILDLVLLVFINNLHLKCHNYEMIFIFKGTILFNKPSTHVVDELIVMLIPMQISILKWRDILRKWVRWVLQICRKRILVLCLSMSFISVFCYMLVNPITLFIFDLIFWTRTLMVKSVLSLSLPLADCWDVSTMTVYIRLSILILSRIFGTFCSMIRL